MATLEITATGVFYHQRTHVAFFVTILATKSGDFFVKFFAGYVLNKLLNTTFSKKLQKTAYAQPDGWLYLNREYYERNYSYDDSGTKTEDRSIDAKVVGDDEPFIEYLEPRSWKDHDFMDFNLTKIKWSNFKIISRPECTGDATRYFKSRYTTLWCTTHKRKTQLVPSCASAMQTRSQTRIPRLPERERRQAINGTTKERRASEMKSVCIIARGILVMAAIVFLAPQKTTNTEEKASIQHDEIDPLS